MNKPNYKPVATETGLSSGPLVFVRNLKKNSVIEGQYLGSAPITLNGNTTTKYMFRAISDISVPAWNKDTESVETQSLKDGDEFALVSTYSLDKTLPAHPAGTFFHITYGGKNKTGNGKTAHNFSIKADESGAQGFQGKVSAVPSSTNLQDLKRSKAIA